MENIPITETTLSGISMTDHTTEGEGPLVTLTGGRWDGKRVSDCDPENSAYAMLEQSPTGLGVRVHYFKRNALARQVFDYVGSHKIELAPLLAHGGEPQVELVYYTPNRKKV